MVAVLLAAVVVAVYHLVEMMVVGLTLYGMTMMMNMLVLV
jgi:hypothetical protein